ncbi:MAG: hypothetical protein Harvfovirus36_2 [Harvfovirus sp.]|uniref:Uncharacterized protein n=1 Tax=Harvfovirus sp. TaxID=2487768 RepID=A0A3G5A5G2_9VIRU|nr:MAG: hypothetical protein Harvfovirus36_2 [Harvfovirus sp.]
MAAAVDAAPVEQFCFNIQDIIPDFSEIRVPKVKALIARLTAKSFVFGDLTHDELCVLMGEIASLLPYYEMIIDQIVLQRLNAAVESAKIWDRLKKMPNGHAVAFYARYFDPTRAGALKGSKKLEWSDKFPFFCVAFGLGERRHSAMALALNSMNRDNRDSDVALKYIKEACLAGNPNTCPMLFSFFFRKQVEERSQIMDLVSRLLMLGERFLFRYISGLDNIIEGKYLAQDVVLDQFISDYIRSIDTLEDAQTMLEFCARTFIKVESLIESGEMDRFHFELNRVDREEKWKLNQFKDHACCLEETLERIIKIFGEDGQKMIISYSSGLNNKALTALIDFSLGSYFASAFAALDDDEDWEAKKVYAIKDDTDAYNLVLAAALAGNFSAYEYLTEKPNPLNQRRKFMYNQFRLRALALPAVS